MLRWFGQKKKTPEPHAPAAPPATVHFTPGAREQILAILGRQAEPAALRILVKQPASAVPEYDMTIDALSAAQPADTLIDAEGVRVLVGADSLALVAGATVDFASDPLRPGFLVQPPQAPQPDLDSDPLAAEVRTLLEDHINPSIAGHGGRADLVGVKDDIVYVALGGGCQGCSMASVTLKQGIEQLIKQHIPRVKAVVDATDHAGGSNPFYTAAKGGESPFHEPAKA
jgi:Fe/S biogenesis protein NfuA